VSKERLNSIESDEEMTGAASFRSFILMPSGPEAFVVFRLNRVSNTSFSVIFIALRLKVGGSANSSKVAIEVLMSHCWRKKEWEISALDKLSDMCSPS